MAHIIIGLVAVFADGNSVPVALGPGLHLDSTEKVPILWIEQPATQPKPSQTLNFYSSPLRKLSDGTWTPTISIKGTILPGSMILSKNGVVQEDSYDFSFDSSNNSIRMLYPMEADDRLYFRFVTAS